MEFKQIERVGKRPSNIPEAWRGFNAPRPLMGHRTWQGPFVSGIFYAAVNPEGEYAQAYLERNHRNDAIELVWIFPEEWRRRVLAYGRRLAEEHDLDLDEFSYEEIESSYRFSLVRQAQ